MYSLLFELKSQFRKLFDDVILYYGLYIKPIPWYQVLSGEFKSKSL